MSDRLENSKAAARYARALFDSTVDAGEAENVAKDLTSLGDVLAQVPDLAAFLENPGIPDNDKYAFIDQQFGKTVSPWVTRLLRLLVENKRTAVIPQLVTNFTELLNRMQNTAQAEVIIAVELEEELRNRIRRTLESTMGFQRVEVETRVDPGILGGMIIKIQDQVIDGSYVGKLEDLRKQLAKS